ncbi:MAG: energy transducer TonB [Labilithrix sp.]|nr:energy transducer TonB [Labilithrix sp.]MBX3219044.1 energy transducer TonB [Labilithrix sp.]
MRAFSISLGVLTMLACARPRTEAKHHEPPIRVSATDEQHATLAPNRSWDCRLPEAAHSMDYDRVSVVIEVHVGADGRPERVDVLQDPGYGFGEAAKDCAMKMRYVPARGSDGEPIRSSTGPFKVRYFER